MMHVKHAAPANSQLSVGSIGLVMAMNLYGAVCVVDAGDAHSLAYVNVPQPDVVAFRDMEDSAIEEYKRLCSG